MRRPRAKPASRRETSDAPARRSRSKTNCIHVEVTSRQTLLKIRPARVRAAVQLVLRDEGVQAAAVEVALVNDATIQEVHRRFFGSDTPTDVITFPLNEPNEPLAGEIVVSVETALREGPRHRLAPADEVLLYAIHGTLHLCGYDDHRAADARKMQQRQSELLGLIRSGV